MFEIDDILLYTSWNAEDAICVDSNSYRIYTWYKIYACFFENILECAHMQLTWYVLWRNSNLKEHISNSTCIYTAYSSIFLPHICHIVAMIEFVVVVVVFLLQTLFLQQQQSIQLPVAKKTKNTLQDLYSIIHHTLIFLADNREHKTNKQTNIHTHIYTYICVERRNERKKANLLACVLLPLATIYNICCVWVCVFAVCCFRI